MSLFQYPTAGGEETLLQSRRGSNPQSSDYDSEPAGSDPEESILVQPDTVPANTGSGQLKARICI